MPDSHASATAEPLEVSCQSCGARILFSALQRTATCPYCDSPSVVDRPSTLDRPDPSFALAFTLDPETAARRMRQWLRKRKMGPFGLTKKTGKLLHGIYLPTYLYSATAHSVYRARIGEWYKDLRGNRATEYYDLEGRYAAYVSDILVTASQGVSNEEVQRIEPFDFRGLVRYTPAVVSGWISEEPSMTREQCLELARRETMTEMDSALRAFMPGDRCADLKHRTVLREESVALTLVPVWIFAVRYDERKPPLRIFVNGQSGKAFGQVPTSWVKVLLLAAFLLAGMAFVGLLIALLGGMS